MSSRAWRIVASLVTASLVSACGDEVVPEQPDPTDNVFPIADRPENSCLAPERPPAMADVQLTPVFESVFPTGQDIPRIIELARAPDVAGRWYLLRQDGTILMFDEGGSQATEALDISDKLWTGHPEVGLVSLAFHPEFDERPEVYLVYTVPTDRGFASRIARYAVRADGTIDANSEEVILDIDEPHGSHSGNHVGFGPDGYLYFVLGDGQNPNDPHRNGQNPNTLLGAVLRLDVDRADSDRGTAYAIPEDNPFVDGGGAPEVYAYGFRNPWRFTFDRETGDLYVGDVGQGTREEVDLIVPGGNYGWPLKEGTTCFEAPEPCDDLPGVIDPAVELSRSEARSVTVGFVYRGSQIPAIEGHLVVADYWTGNFWTVEFDDAGQPTASLQLESGLNPVSFAEDADGELYMVHYSPSADSGIYRLDPAEERISAFPALLSESGCVDPDDPTLPAQGVTPFEPISPLWSDGADKQRFFSVPRDRRIAVADNGDFLFPVGSVLMKHFAYDGLLHETRLLMRHEDGWAGYSYEWNAQQTDAVLLETGKTTELPGGQPWVFPTRAQCMSCHTSASERALGPESLQLDHVIAFEGEDDTNQLVRLHATDYFDPEFETLDDVPALAGLPTMPDPFGDAPLEERVRAYLHSNCANCHQPGGPGRGGLDMRFTTPLADTRFCGPPEEGTMYLPDPERLVVVSPGVPEDSVLYLRMESLTEFRMPPLGTNVVDTEGLELVGEWIEGMDDCP